MGRFPSREEALEMLRSAGCPPEVIRHCEDVASLALRIAKACLKSGIRVDLRLVEIGALLHDIGRSRTHGIGHVFVGAEMAREAGLDESIIRVILTHTGGLRPGVAEQFGWPPGSYEPSSLEEKIVAYADKLVEGGKIVPFSKALEKLVRDLGPDHPAVGNLMAIHEELRSYLGGGLACGGPGEDLRPL